MSLLNGALAGVFAAAFRPIYLPAYVHRYGPMQYDDGGSVVPSEPDLIDAFAQVDQCTEAMRQAEGYTERDVRLIVLREGVGELTTDDRVELLSGPCTGVYLVQSIGVDPAGAYLDCRARPA